MFSYACAISDDTEVIITGGFGARTDVSVYSMTGFQRNLPDLNTGRQYHACASYINIYNEKVKKNISIISVATLRCLDIVGYRRLRWIGEFRFY